MIDSVKSEKYIRLESLGMGPYAMRKLKVCSKCGQIVGARTLFCPVCKTRLPIKTLFDFYKRMHFECPHCGITLATDAQYCPHCGRKVI
ncbi:MAG: zinc ribbon domain-containing protein [Clostridia bacterium]|nr:zinc ribbon domain-containing protein [Clostridia bacterium]